MRPTPDQLRPFLLAICEDFGHAGPFSDWLDDNGHHEKAAAVRFGIEMAHMEPPDFEEGKRIVLAEFPEVCLCSDLGEVNLGNRLNLYCRVHGPHLADLKRWFDASRDVSGAPSVQRPALPSAADFPGRGEQAS